MPVSLSNGISPASIPSFLDRACCIEKAIPYLKFPCRQKVSLRESGSSYGCLCAAYNCTNYSALRKKRSKLVRPFEKDNTALNGGKKSYYHSCSVADSQALVLERDPDDTDLTENEVNIEGPRRVEVVGRDLDLEEEISLMRKRRSSVPKKRKKTSVKLNDALQSWSDLIEDRQKRGVSVSEEVQLRSEGDASNLAGSDTELCSDLSYETRQNERNETISEVIDLGEEDKEVRTSLPSTVRTLSGGSQIIADLTTAWDSLSGKVSPSIRSGKLMQQLMSALKLTVSAIRRAQKDGRLMLANSLSIAYSLADMQMDATVMAAGLLRPVLEAGLVSISIIDQQLGSDVSRLLYDCMRFQRTLDQMDLFDEESARAVRQFCLSYHDIRSISIEFSARLYQMRCIAEVPRYKQQILALEALQIHAPLAHAIGSKELSTELEDLSFKVIFPESYSSLDRWLSSHLPDGNSVLEECKLQLASALAQDKKLKSLIEDFTITGRVKSRFSTMKKLLKNGRRPEEIHDIMGLRVVIETKPSRDDSEAMQMEHEACYRVLDVVRTLWKVIPGRLKDYIANPKTNGYKSLHVALDLANLNSRQGTLELQIRTSTMDFIANDGDASHSLYKGGLTDPEQVKQLKKLMMAAAERAALSLKELTGNVLLLQSEAKKDEVFKLFDKNNDGKISITEFKQVMDELGADERDAYELMQLADTNNDGTVSAEEFEEFKKQVNILQGFDKQFSNKLGQRLRDTNEIDQFRYSNSSFGSNLSVSVESKDQSSITSEEDEDQSEEDELSPIVRYDTVEVNEIQGNQSENLQKVSSLASVKKSMSLSRPNFISKSSSDEGVLRDETLDKKNEIEAIKKNSVQLDRKAGLKTLRRLISAKKIKSAEDVAKQLYEQFPGDTDVLMEYAYIKKQKGDLVAAGALYSKAITAFEDKSLLGYDYIRALQALGSIEARARNAKRARVLFIESINAAQQAEKQTNLKGASVYGLHAWARLEEQIGNWSKAQELLARAAEIQPGNAVVHQSRALLEAKAHNWGAARQNFKLAVKAAPNDVKCWHAWAIFEGSQGKRPKMRQLFQRALEIDPNNVHSLQAWAHQETLINTPESKERARSLFQRCTEIDPQNLFCWQAWAVMEHSSGNYEKARQLFGKCLIVNPSSVVCLQAFANMERKLGNVNEAQKLIWKALKIDPENAAVLMESALVEEALGNKELSGKLFVFAGLADKRKSKVKNQMFISRKASKRLPKYKSRKQNKNTGVHTTS